MIVGATTYELKSACDTMKDSYDLDHALNPEGMTAEDRDKVCGLQVPSKERHGLQLRTPRPVRGHVGKCIRGHSKLSTVY